MLILACWSGVVPGLAPSCSSLVWDGLDFCIFVVGDEVIEVLEAVEEVVDGVVRRRVRGDAVSVLD